ncbi:uncharacterized protein [Euwallacea fornicatus]|uniref:uncharacterized protein n=1 Tax=Euwallacea fornicatus TaxID=995702 RepID=UPI00338EEB5A
MNRLSWKSRKSLVMLLGLLALYFTIRVRKYVYETSTFLPMVPPNEPWEFIADFSNMKFLNPTITEFTITEESGNYEHWKYSVEYAENLSHWPYLANHATAHFQVRSNLKTDFYVIQSVHKTCLFLGTYCLESESEFKFSRSNLANGSICQENVEYECPAFLSAFCKREVRFQREAIMTNLQRKFLKN